MRSPALIVAPVDFSESSAASLRYATQLARLLQADLDLVHVRNTNPDAGISRHLDQVLAGEPAGAAARRVILQGDAAPRIVEYARERQAGLIVMATHGHRLTRPNVVGSTTARVLRDADCPVWTGIRLEATPTLFLGPFRSIVCAVDLGPQSHTTVQWATGLQKEFGARLTLVHALTPPASDRGALPRWLKRARQTTEDELSRLAQETGAYADLSVKPGEPERVIAALVLRAGGDILVIGRGSLDGMRKHTYALIRQSACPVVSV